MSAHVDLPWTTADAGAADLDADSLSEVWATSGMQALTDRAVAVPARLVAGALALIGDLDRRGAALAEQLPARGLGVLAERSAAIGLTRSVGLASCGGATRFVRSADGWIALSLARPDDTDLVPAWLGIGVCDGDPWDAVVAGAADRTSAELTSSAAELGLACSTVGEARERPPFVATPSGDAAPAPLTGLTVANLGSLWAAPLAGDLLARLGARVIKVESATRPDGARAHPAFFDLLAGGSESVALPLRSPAGQRQLAALLAQVDVVIEASRPRALLQMGIDATALVRTGPRIWLSITGHGRSAAPQRVGFGDDAAAAGGLVGWVDGDTEREPRFIGDAVADPLTGLTAAALVGRLADSGGRWLVDVALAGVAAAFAPRPSDRRVAATHAAAEPTARRGPPAPPLGRDTASVLYEFGVTC